MGARAFSHRFRVSYPDGRLVPPDQFLSQRARTGVVSPRYTAIFYPREGERRMVESSAAPVRLPGSIGTYLVVSVMRDVTDREEMERLKDDFIATLAHELRSPLTSIKAHTQHALRQGGTPAEASHRAVQRACGRIERIVEQLIEAVRVKAGDLPVRMERFDLHACVERLVKRHQQVSPYHRFDLFEEGEAEVVCDPRRFQEVLDHLLDNAVRYSPHGGAVQVRVRQQGDMLEVSVEDRGVGIPLIRQAHLFERYYRAHAGTEFDYGGMGIGLFVSKTLAEAMGGQMGFESQEGRGSRFWFTVPLLGGPPDETRELSQRLRWATQVEGGAAW
jgi:signal transduction histidine kinase